MELYTFKNITYNRWTNGHTHKNDFIPHYNSVERKVA